MKYTYEDTNGDEITIDVEYKIWGKHRRSTMIDPEEFPEIEIQSITLNGIEFDPPDDELGKIEEECWSEASSNYDEGDQYDR